MEWFVALFAFGLVAWVLVVLADAWPVGSDGASPGGGVDSTETASASSWLDDGDSPTAVQFYDFAILDFGDDMAQDVASSDFHDDMVHDFASDDSLINPATGFSMIGGMGGIDVGGSPFGFDTHMSDAFSDDHFSHTTFDSTDDWSSIDSSSGFGSDPFAD